MRLKQTFAGGEATWGKSITGKGPMGKAPDLSKQKIMGESDKDVGLIVLWAMV